MSPSNSRLLKQPIQRVAFAFLDTETTGIAPSQGARVCELAILTVRDGRCVSRFQSLIHPECPIDPEAQRIHGITDDMVVHSPTFKQLAARIKRLLRAKTLVCHNAPFDICFLQAEFQRAGVDMPKIPVLDTLNLARRYFQFQRNNLGHIARSLGIEPQGWHRAGNDVQLLSRIFEIFLAEFSRKGARTLEDLLKL